MKKNNTSVEATEVAKFAQFANEWWDTNGPFKTLHDINPLRIEFIQKHLNINGLRGLDLGCGGGILSEGLAKLKANMTGLDVEEDTLVQAKEHAKMHDISLDYVCEPVESYESPQYDFITCMEMLEHVASPEMIIQNAARLLKKEGYLFLSTINRNLKSYCSVIIGAEYLLNLLPRQTHDYQKFIKPSELASLLRKYHFKLIDICGLNYHPFTRHASFTDSVDINYLIACQLQAS